MNVMMMVNYTETRLPDKPVLMDPWIVRLGYIQLNKVNEKRQRAKKRKRE
jgi:hypothetical protein